jgi:MscS family membrane protein
MKSSKLILHFILIWFTAAIALNSASAREVSSRLTGPTDDLSFEPDAVINPLKPADTSSPRDTLQSFFTDMDIVLSDFQENNVISSEAGYRAYKRVVSMLDFSLTPNGDSRVTMVKRCLLLLEILNRIELPPESDIPGDEEVEKSGMKRWTLPNTRLTIQRIENGPRTGEFLFSAKTVERLHRNYLLVKHLPYRRAGATNIFEKYTATVESDYYMESMMRNILRPVDAESPRATLVGFLDSVNRAYTLVMETNAALKTSSPKLTRDDARKAEIFAMNLIKRAMATLDMSRTSASIRDDVGVESVLQLKEILDRLVLPLIESVPDSEMVRSEKERISKTTSGAVGQIRWRYPNTTIEIVEIMEGPKKGRFLFSADTVKRLDQLYRKVRHLPYRRDNSELAREYVSPGISKGFYEYYISTPGILIPGATVLGGLADSLPDWFDTMYGDQPVWQWVFLGISLSLGVLFLVTLHGMLLRRPGKLSDASRNWRRVLFYLIAAGTSIFLFHFVDEIITITGTALYVSRISLEMFFWWFLSTVAVFLAAALAETIVASPKIDPDGIQASYIRGFLKLVGFFGAAAVFITGLSRVGVSLVPLLAGVGIGGLAIALAARPTIENIIGSFMIFLDKPYQVGQRVNVLGQDGTVEAVGLRSTKIRLLNGHLTSIPNEKMAAAEVVNIGRRPHIRRLFNVTITYDTPPDKINRALEILREILAVPEATEEETTDTTTKLADEDAAEKQASTSAVTKAPMALAAMIEDIESDYHPNWAINRPDFEPRVSFNEFNADSLNILVIYWYHPPDYWEYLDHATWVNTQIVERFNAEGIDFAFPTQTLHLAGDEKRPLDLGQRMVSKDDASTDSGKGFENGAVSDSAGSRGTAADISRPRELTDAPPEDDVL